MSEIQLECAREKGNARQSLWEAREEMLQAVKKHAEEGRKGKICLKGQSNWMVPSLGEKLKLKSKKKKSEKKKDAKKKSKQRSGKKRRYSSSGTSTDTSDTDSSSEETNSISSKEERKIRRKSKKNKKSSNMSKKSRKSVSSNSEESDNDKERGKNIKLPSEQLTRDSWMTSPLMVKTYSKEKLNHKPSENQQICGYDPTKSIRELNPYWKTTGTGLPAFLKPKEYNDDNNIQSNDLKSSFFSGTSSSKSWKKRSDGKVLTNEPPSLLNKRMPSGEEDNTQNEKRSTLITPKFLTDQQMNELGAKVIKAELMGNILLAGKLREQLENARSQRNIFKKSQEQTYIEGKRENNLLKGNKKEDSIVLTHTDKAGSTRPLLPSSEVLLYRDPYVDKRKQRQKSVKTHNEFGERVRYFADDDRFSIKDMFEREKYKSSSDANLEFANIASKHKSPDDDMEDIFVEKICRDDSLKSNQEKLERAIREHQKIEATLDSCSYCIDSTKINRELLICVGDKVYLALPWYQGLQEGHCIIVPNQHAACCTQIDEDTWTEINDFRKALTRMFSAQLKDVIFFEIANRLHKCPHLVIHCIPIRKSDAEMAPFYFKKAIEESEHEWCINKQLVLLRGKSLRSCIPKGLPYFWVNFGMETGFAHVIEDEKRFPANFAQEIIGGMLNLDPKKWRKVQKEQNITVKVQIFADFWKKYDCTKS